MIGRLQNELVRVNSQVGELDTQLERMKRAEAECERLKTRVASLEAAQQGAENALGAANSKAPLRSLEQCCCCALRTMAMQEP